MTDPVPCPECGSRPHPDDRYCPDCGAQLPTGPVAPARTTAEYAGPPVGSAMAAAAANPSTGADGGHSGSIGANANGIPGPEAARPNSGPTGSAANAAAGEATGTTMPAAFGTWNPRADGGAGSPAPAPATSVGTPATPEPASGERPIAPAAAAAAAAAVAAANGTGTTAISRSPSPEAEDPGWFGASSPGSMLGMGLVLIVAGILLVLVGKIDRTGTIGIIGLLIAVGGAFMIPLAALRAVASRIV